MECSFFFEVLAPDGLNDIDIPIKESGLDLYIYCSGFNNKNILKSKSDGIIELGMDTSTTEMMHGSGYFECDFQQAKDMAEVLSNIFELAGYSHKIGVDDENGENTVWYTHQYS